MYDLAVSWFTKSLEQVSLIRKSSSLAEICAISQQLPRNYIDFCLVNGE